ncbi:MAG TPA: hypothetical protein VKV18_01485 [Chthonomonas sp.]|uniref:hypothetical protein n=1 Tax=Chthonomonas sp. TaxID=2282153 RepID=UPI002B4B755A|nr:hypothetical protein [Chthonomonas sp.]HLI47349.1 hypothetical protein [Chthonomonas sp.]
MQRPEKRDDYGNWAGRKGAVREDAHREVPLSQSGEGEWRWGLVGVGPEEPVIRLSFRATGEINNCHFEPMPRLSFRAEGEKS